jgi:hypothetical protein
MKETSMKAHWIAAGIALALAGASVPASAQGIEFGPGGVRIDRGERFDRGDDVSRGEAVRIARGEGLRDVDDVSRRGRRWIVEGSDRRGNDIRVTIDSRDGSVVDVERD